MELCPLLGVALGGLIGFVSAFGLEAVKRHWMMKSDRQKLDRLLEILYEEVEQLAELIDVDLSVVENEERDFIENSGKRSEEFNRVLRTVIMRLQENRTIYDSQAANFLDLPEYLPNSLVRFYTRLQVNCGRMLTAIDEGDLDKIREIRSVSLAEAETLKSDLIGARSKRQ